MRHDEELRGGNRVRGGIERARFGWSLDGEPCAPVNEKVEIELARASSSAAAPTEGALETLERREESQRPGRRVPQGRGVEGDDGVAELRLVGHPDGMRRVETRHSPDVRPGKLVEGHDG
jgi:hypothetical protein